MAVPDRKTFEVAASWYVQFQSQTPTAADRKAWQQWLSGDPSHQAAWDQIEQLQRSLGALPQDFTRRALSTTQQRRQVLKWMLVLGGTGYLGWNVQQCTPLANPSADYRTSVGERRRIELADGTRIDLNTNTAIDVVFDGHKRLIRLREGEVLIHTGKFGGQTPFYVETLQGRVQALGTRFTVRQLPGSTRVGVLEDWVSVSPVDQPSHARLLGAGESADFDRQNVGPNTSYRGSEAAWVDGQLIVLDARLAEVMDELARYRPGVLKYDSASARLRISGTFRLDSTDAVLANLQATLPIQVKYFTRYWVSVTRIG
ncbi:Fe2+-dicitrate sensor, membrane component [Pseudomonas synxantha]|uniref:Fe2+-dicitrate sensor, membrane component n=1 Tax=Pseudomonas synxantha TaxID=47883 RepID=A0A3G7UG44_9PSED|nr:FecR domain-containing protein [Pseudomonas synxantha]AZE58397.1 Fe2+-dicitrate sensor, membrane component [Pseudomonas synxantha]